MNTSATLQSEVEQELRWDPSVISEDVGVTVKGEVIQLDGQVSSLWEKWAAEKAAMRVKHVRSVANEIKVECPSTDRCSDTDIARAAITHLEWNSSVPSAVKILVSDGWITLGGSVESQYQKMEAEIALRPLKGIKGILNEITIQPKVSGDVIGTHISDAFRRSAAIDAQAIQVEASEGRVTLRGSVHTWEERWEAERTAWSAPGVTNVDDLLTIAGLGANLENQGH